MGTCNGNSRSIYDGNSANSRSIYGDKESFISVNFNDLDQVDKQSYFIVFGFIKKYAKLNNTIVPYPIICICLSYYYFTLFVDRFDINYCNSRRWRLSNHYKTIIANSSTYGVNYAVYQLNDGYCTGIQYAAVLYERGYFDNARCLVGVTCNLKSRSFLTDTEPPFCEIFDWHYFDGTQEPYFWQKSKIILKVDLNNWMVYFYKQFRNKRKFIKQIVLNADKRYYIALKGRSDRDFYQKFSIVDVETCGRCGKVDEGAINIDDNLFYCTTC